jgi:hypothetical protein
MTRLALAGKWVPGSEEGDADSMDDRATPPKPPAAFCRKLLREGDKGEFRYDMPCISYRIIEYLRFKVLA